MDKITQLSILQMAERISKGVLSPVEIVKAHLEHIDQLEADIKAWKLVDRKRALETAELLAEEVRLGRIRSPLHGIPIGVKDNIDVAGLPTQVGSKVFQHAKPAQKDAKIVAKLKALGAIILGKTHTTEFTWFDPAPTRNPFNHNHTPGGSSSGSAAAVSAGMVPLAIGSQTAASVCRPAAYCGISALKPSWRNLPTDGVFPLAPTFDSLGFFGRTWDDVSLAYEVFHQHGHQEKMNLSHHSVKILKVGIVEDPLYQREGSPHAIKVVKQISKLFEEAGHAVERVTPPHPFDDFITLHRQVVAYEAAEYHGATVQTNKANIGHHFVELVESGMAITKESYEKARRLIEEMKADTWKAFQPYDVLISPPVPASAPKRLDTTGPPNFTTPWTVLGGPLSVIPVALDSNGLPLAVMLAAAPGNDTELIQISKYVERMKGLNLKQLSQA
ncbi:Asp-tRNA(Asn)/Glu-tRNA(Gln) amidotransferase A subunit family amidase [Caldalkalibacillus uzonensis]|uniref:Asp-tRNA(Asn)/Glu-tRNA(Gln) amidotransferase A subunit family amidase n=1 Tax=Caldalkalibacillus uzonensis TaxID=353224 RepID=A0ABU0CTI8_9BACI|nr:amidase [Caldalkalibacillus uzonensis]MDQ0338357.1 Asp-tRNA(Asn)/Glu-tRNA(Gln) amidotransferase A subunit family amidase [Caldalkalibacillus uzonensis]